MCGQCAYKVHIVIYLPPVTVQKHQMAQFLLYLTSFVISVHKSSRYFDIFDPCYGLNYQKAHFAVFDIICAHYA